MQKNSQDAWQQSLKNAITSISSLCDALNLNPDTLSTTDITPGAFPLRVPLEFIARMEKGNPNDPLLLQILPRTLESQIFPGFKKDPLQEKEKNPIPGLLHKYPHRVLLTLTGGCAINCRYCFRRHFPYEDNLPGRENWKKIFNYISDNQTIEEVILSGGDPLLLKDDLLKAFITELSFITHVQRLRIHTRLPIVIPSRITKAFVELLTTTRFNTVLVTHANHPNEIDQEVIQALKKLSAITLLNQAVLLKDINDNADVLALLNKKMFEAKVLPYYLHLLDKVEGAGHFEVTQEKAELILQALKEKLPGFLVPKLAREIPGMLHKAF